MTRKVFITGGTGSVGQKLVEKFAENGYEVVFQYRSDEEKAQQLAESTGSETWQCDFEGEFELPEEEFDIVVNSAGVLLDDTYTVDVSEEVWRKTLEVNLTAPFKIVKKYLPGMIESGWGRIINIGSIYSLEAVENNLSYNVSKHGLSGLTKSVAKEYAAEGVTCNEICPSAVKSETMENIAERKAKETELTEEEFLDQVRNANPANRMAHPGDIASAALFLASEDARFVNGESIVVDGGQTC